MLSSKSIFLALLSWSLIVSTPSLATPYNHNTVKIQAAFEFSSIDPSRSGYVFTRMQVIETLVDVNEKGQLTPALASDWNILDNGLRWRFTLRNGVQFHNGQTLTSEDVVHALNIARTKPGVWQGVPVTDITAPDEQHVDILLNSPYRPLGAIIANYASAILAPASYSDDNVVRELIGTGPFSIYEVQVPHRAVVQRFPEYWGKVAEVEYARYLTGHRAEARVLQARSGQGDIVFGLDPASVPMLKRMPNLTIEQTDLPRTLALKLNAAHPLLNTQSTRQALSLAINREGIANAVLRTPNAATEQLLPAYMSDWYVANTDTSQQLEKAKSLLAAEGWQRNSDGLLERNGKLFELTLITYADRPELTAVATAIQDQWRQLGVKLNVNITNSSAIPAGHQDGSLEVALIARNYGTIADPLGVLIKDFGQDKGGDWGSTGWSNQDIKPTLSALVKETDESRYNQQAQRIAQAIYDEKPLIPIAYYVQQTAVTKRLSGFRYDPYERSYFLNELSWNN